MHLLVTNDFPPKVGGIQSYLWELWRRLPADEVVVLTTPHPDSVSFDAAAPMRIVRARQRWLLPTRVLRNHVVALANEIGTDFVLFDPAVPVGTLGPSLAQHGLRYGVILHGAEVTLPGRVPILKPVLARTLRGSSLTIAAGGYPLAEAERAAGQTLDGVVIPPGVDTALFRPVADDNQRAEDRRRLGIGFGDPSTDRDDPHLIVCASRLVPRKGFDVVIDAAGLVADRLGPTVVAVSGAGRDRDRLERVAHNAERRHKDLDVRFLGRTSDDDLRALYRCGDVYAMLCHNRKFGLEQEGFGIVFVEAAASGVPQIAGMSGGSHEAVIDGVTGTLVRRPRDPVAVAEALVSLLSDPVRRTAMGAAGRQRAETALTYDVLAGQLHAALRRIAPKSPGVRDASL